MSARHIRQQLRRGELVTVYPHVVRSGHAVSSDLGRAWSVRLTAEGEAAIAGRLAARLLGMRGVALGPTGLIVPASARSRRLPDIEVRRVHDWSTRRFDHFQGLLVCSPQDTIVDLARELGDRLILRVMQDAVTDGLVTPTAVLEQCQHGRLGSERARHAASRLLDGLGSHPERTLLDGIRTANLPMPVPGLRVCDAEGRTVYVLDFPWPWLRFVVELDGFRHHSDRRAARRDRRRDRNLLAGLGYQTVRYLTDEVDDDLEGVVSEIGDSLLRRSGELGVPLERPADIPRQLYLPAA